MTASEKREMVLKYEKHGTKDAKEWLCVYAEVKEDSQLVESSVIAGEFTRSLR
jgi:hypothetical protein